MLRYSVYFLLGGIGLAVVFGNACSVQTIASSQHRVLVLEIDSIHGPDYNFHYAGDRRGHFSA